MEMLEEIEAQNRFTRPIRARPGNHIKTMGHVEVRRVPKLIVIHKSALAGSKKRQHPSRRTERARKLAESEN
jgi:hypothetical protein